MELFVPPTLWYENGNGEMWIPPMDGNLQEPPEGFNIQFSQFPNSLTTSALRVEDGKSKHIMAGTSSWWEQLVLAMVSEPTFASKDRPAPMGLRDAILIAATACERCMNALMYAYRRGNEKDQGYAEDSDQYRNSRTRCHFCDPSLKPKIRS